MNIYHIIERRQSTRYPATGNVSLRMGFDPEIYSGQLNNFSANGMFIVLERPLDKKWTHKNGEILLSATTDRPLHIIVEICVTRVSSEGVGIFITNINSSTKAAFMEFLIYAHHNNTDDQKRRLICSNSKRKT